MLVGVVWEVVLVFRWWEVLLVVLVVLKVVFGGADGEIAALSIFPTAHLVVSSTKTRQMNFLTVLKK